LRASYFSSSFAGKNNHLAPMSIHTLAALPEK
jgi:hypothetical protein